MRMTAIGGALLGATILLFTGLHVEIHVRPGLLDALQEPQPSRQQTPTPPFVTSGEPTDATMRNVDFHIDQGIVLRIRHLLGQMHGRGGVVDFDNVSSYTMDVESAVVGMRGSDLTTLMNRYVFNYRGAPITNLRVEITPQGVRQTGTLHKGVAIPFDMTAAPSVTADGRIQLRATRVRILGVDGLKLMNALGLSLESMMNLSKARGITVEHNTLILDALKILPPPEIRGTLTGVRIVGDELVMTIGDPDLPIPSQTIDPESKNYMLYRHGTLHFTKLFMPDAEMLVTDMDQSDPFDFDNLHYQRQVIAGHSKTLPSLGLEVFMPDASSLPPRKPTIANDP
jgi:Domain of unknown function (DUF811).